MCFGNESSGMEDGESSGVGVDLYPGNGMLRLDFLGGSQIAEPCFWYSESGTASCFWRGVVGSITESESGNVENVGETGV